MSFCSSETFAGIGSVGKFKGKFAGKPGRRAMFFEERFVTQSISKNIFTGGEKSQVKQIWISIILFDKYRNNLYIFFKQMKNMQTNKPNNQQTKRSKSKRKKKYVNLFFSFNLSRK